MRIDTIGCPICARAKMDEGAESEQVARASLETMRGARITTEIAQLQRCTAGHDFLLQLQDGGYALLYERALQRLVDGRTRDAVLDAYTAFEMFLGTFVLSAAFETRYPAPMPLDKAPLELLREDLKEVLRLSERTIGAALTLASISSGKTPPRIPDDLTKLRNRAAHAGAYPSDSEAEGACLKVEVLVCGFREQFPRKTIEEAPIDRFHMALVLESTRRALGSGPPVQSVTCGLFSVLDSANHDERRNAAGRI